MKGSYSGELTVGKQTKRNRAEALPCKDDLMGSLEHAWQMLSIGAKNRRVPFHLATLATVGVDGRPKARVVVLRECDRAQRVLRFHTDRRSRKYEEFRTTPKAELLFYDEYEKIQLRLQVRLEALEAEEADAIWEKTPWYSRECYQVTRPPGTPIEGLDEVQFDANEASGGRANFSPMRAHIESIEWLYLSAQKHRRARFVFSPDGVAAHWLVP